ncbi:MAG: Gfo/Idh/MocA family protein [Flexilinea sp.]
MEKVRFGIIGSAGIAKKRFIPAIAHASNAELLAVASRQQNKAAEYAAENQIPAAFGSYEEMLSQPDIDAVYIPLPNGLHKEWSLKAIEAGKHVLCEKPLAPTQKDCIEMGDAAKANGVYLMEAFMYRFHPLTEFVIGQVQKGALGEIASIQTSFTFVLDDPGNVRFVPDLAGGAVMDVGCYGINCVRTFFGEEPEAVSALAHYRHPKIDDQMNIFARFKSGRQAQIVCGFTAKAPEGYTISGSKGWITAYSGFLAGVEHGTVTQEINGVRSTFQDSTNEYTRMIEHFSDCVLNKKRLRYDAYEAGYNMAFICAAKESAEKNGEWVYPGQN